MLIQLRMPQCLLLVISLIVLMPSFTFANHEAHFVRMIDSDTLLVRVQDRYERIDLVGVKLKSNVRSEKVYASKSELHPENSMRPPWSRVYAQQFMAQWLKQGDPLQLKLEIPPRNRYSHLQGYVFLQDGTMLNRLMLESGYYLFEASTPNLRLKDELLGGYYGYLFTPKRWKN